MHSYRVHHIATCFDAPHGVAYIESMLFLPSLLFCEERGGSEGDGSRCTGYVRSFTGHVRNIRVRYREGVGRGNGAGGTHSKNTSSGAREAYLWCGSFTSFLGALASSGSNVTVIR